DPRPDGYSYAGCWAYTLFRKGDEFYLDGERCDEEDRRRLRIEEWLWQPLPPHPGSRSKDDDVRDDALRDGAQGDAEALAGELLAELGRAREKFRGYNVTALALFEEVGELAKALIDESRAR